MPHSICNQWKFSVEIPKSDKQQQQNVKMKE